MFQNPKIVLAPAYGRLAEEIRKIPSGDFRVLQTYCNQRNTVCKIELNGEVFVLKRYKRPTRLNRVAYTLFRKSKARRAYEYALRMQQLGFETAEPVAYLEISRCGLFHTGYFLSEFISHPLLSSLREEEEDEYQKILKDFAAFSVEMHEKGVFNLDMNPGNVFYYKSGENYRFALIDINRIRFRRHLTRNDCVEVFKHLDNLPPPALSIVLAHYAHLRNWNPQLLCGAVMLRQGVNLPRRIKTKFRAILSRLGLRKKD